MTENRNNGVFGNLAYDFRTRDTYTPEEYSAGNKAAPQKAKKPLGVKRPGQSVSPFALAGGTLAAAMLLCSLLAQAHLTAVSNETVAVRESIAQLRQEQTRLEIQLSQALEPAELERYARDVLGMRRPNADQIEYTDSSREGEIFPAG